MDWQQKYYDLEKKIAVDEVIRRKQYAVWIMVAGYAIVCSLWLGFWLGKL